ncbi:MAG: tetratricopeptide repeat protein [Pirellulales bacterium]|nr:tetratricopeptide repeat protein [Pirellulales bacterium]
MRVEFTFDDSPNILNNKALHWDQISWSNIAGTMKGPSWLRPVANFSFGLNYYFGQEDVWGYHAVNVCVHAIVACLVYLLALTTLRLSPPSNNASLSPSTAHWIALASALVFACHPIQTQAVTYIVQRMTSMCTMFYLAALLLYIYGRTNESRSRRWLFWLGSFMLWLLALGSKEFAATLPIVVVLYEWYFFRDLSLRWIKKDGKFGLLAYALPGLVVIAGMIAIIALSMFDKHPIQWVMSGYYRRDFTLGERLLTQPRIVMFYVSLLAYPHPSRLNLNHDVDVSQSVIEPVTTLFSILGVCGLLALAIYLAPRYRLASFCLVWFLLHQVIESTVIGLEMIFEHRMYLPMFGASLLFASTVFELARNRPRWAIGFVAIVCVLLSIGTIQRNRAWRDAVSLWSDIVAKSPQNWRAHRNLGAVLLKDQRADEALVHLHKSLSLKADWDLHVMVGGVLLNAGRYREAIEHFERVPRDRPIPFIRAQRRLAWLLATCPEASIRDGKRALEHALVAADLSSTDNFATLEALAVAYAEVGNFEKAVELQQKAVSMADGKRKGKLIERLELFKRNEPYRDHGDDRST